MLRSEADLPLLLAGKARAGGELQAAARGGRGAGEQHLVPYHGAPAGGPGAAVGGARAAALLDQHLPRVRARGGDAVGPLASCVHKGAGTSFGSSAECVHEAYRSPGSCPLVAVICACVWPG